MLCHGGSMRAVPYLTDASSQSGCLDALVRHVAIVLFTGATKLRPGGCMIGAFKRFLVGRPIETAAQHDQRLSKRIALAVFSSDALSSVAYASEAILVVLITAGAGSLPLVIEISLGIALLL